MEKRKLGNSGIEVAPIALGGNVFGWTIDEATSFQVLDGFLDAGFNLVDTADVYSRWKRGNEGGESETIIGNWMKENGNRNKVVLATKVGMELADGKGLAKNRIFKCVEDSLRRLQTDYIDLYQSHKDDPDTPQEETLEAHAELVKQGKVRAIGASNFSAARLAEALEISSRKGYPAYVSLQPQYNLYDRDLYEQELEPFCLEHNLGVITYFSLASGFLTGKYRSSEDYRKSVRGGGMKRFMNERGLKILAALDEVSKDLNATQAQIALAWLMARKGITAPIVSATSTEQLNDILKAVDVKLDVATISKLDEASAWVQPA
jgi:aryl-alcohol dehydrogenase-like predicted oxidoreductase